RNRNGQPFRHVSLAPELEHLPVRGGHRPKWGYSTKVELLEFPSTSSVQKDSICRNLIEHFPRRQPVPVTMTDLFKKDLAIFVEEERRWISRFIGGIPSQSIEIGHLILRINNKNDVGWKLRLFG